VIRSPGNYGKVKRLYVRKSERIKMIIYTNIKSCITIFHVSLFFRTEQDRLKKIPGSIVYAGE
jgi:RAB protein geranylgeranyltransferase component A